MTSVNPLLALWRAGKPSLGGWLTTADPQIAEYLASGGFDEICVDQQHGLADSSNLASVFRALEVHGVAPTTRVPSNDFAAIGFALDIGAVAIIVPMVGSAEEAAAAADACHFPPRGRRSVGPLRGAFVARLGPARRARRGGLRGDDRDARTASATSTPSRPRPASMPSTSVPATWRSAWACRPGRRTGRQPRPSSTPTPSSGSGCACVANGIAPGMHTGDGAVGPPLPRSRASRW